MAKKRLIARAGRGLINGLALLFRGVGALCAAVWSLFLSMAAYYKPEEDEPHSYLGEYDPLKPLGSPGRKISHDQAEEYGYDSW